MFRTLPRQHLLLVLSFCLSVFMLAAPEAAAFSGRVVSQQSGKCLDVVRGNRDAAVVMWDCNGGQNQRWRLENGALVSQATGQCVYMNAEFAEVISPLQGIGNPALLKGLVTRDCRLPCCARGQI